MLLRLALLLTVSLTVSSVLMPLQAQRPNLQMIQGQVEDAQGAPVSAALVQLSGLTGGTLQSQVSDGSGAFSFMVNAQGPFVLTVTTPYDTVQSPLDDASLGNVLVKLPNSQPAHRVDAAHAVVSVNDLEASGKAKSKLRDATKALQKYDFRKASKLVNEAIQASPNWGRPYVLRGVISFIHHDYPSARADLSTAVARDPKNSVALTQMGKLEATTGHLQSAQMYLDRALSIAPVEWPTYLETSSLDLQLHNYPGAAAMASQAMHCTPPAPDLIHYFAAEAADHLGHPEQALQEYKTFVAHAGQDANNAAAIVLAEKRLRQLESKQTAVVKPNGQR